MPPESVPADPGRDDDLAWLDRDPMTAGEREASLDRLCQQDEPPPGDEEDEDFNPLTPEELTEIRQAAADDLLAVEAATTGRRGRPARSRAAPDPDGPWWLPPRPASHRQQPGGSPLAPRG